MSELDFLEEPQGSDTTPVVETPAPEAQAPEPEVPAAEAAPPADTGQPRGADGKFLPKAADAQPQPEAAPVQPPAVESARPPEGYVPIAVVQAMREEMNAFKRQQQAPAQPPPPPPDHFVDPDGFRAWTETQQIMERADWSRQLAEARHGADTVTKAQQWAEARFAQDPVFRQQSLATRDPYGFAINEYQRDQALQMLANPELLQKFQAFVTGAQPAPQTAQPPAHHIPPQVEAPPPSIVAAPNAGGRASEPVGQVSAYDAALS